MNQQGAHRYEDRLLEFAYGELPAAEARSIEAHVKGCARCTGALQEIHGVRHQMAQLAPEPAPEAGLESLLAYAEQAARRTQAGPAPARGFRRWLFGAVGAASLAAVLVVVGVVVNRKDLAPASPATIQQDEARRQIEADQAAAPPPAVASAAAPLEQPKEQVALKQAGERNAKLAEVDGQANDEGRSREWEPSTESPASDPVAAATPEPKIGKAVGNENEYVQRVDVTTADEKAAAKLDAKYREKGTDSPDRMQNAVPGLGSIPPLPTSRTQGYAQKTATAPSDGEMVFPEGGKGKGGDYKPAKKPAPVAATAPSRKKSAPLSGSGGGLGDDLSSSLGRGRGGATTKDADDSFSIGMGSTGSTSGGNKNVPSGAARPAAPSSPPAQSVGQSLDTRNRAALEAEVQAKQRAEEESERHAQAESTRRDLELQKAERSKAAQTDEDGARYDDLGKKSVATRETRSAPAPTPAAAAPAPAAGPSKDRGADKVAMNAPPPAAAPARAPAAEPAPPQAQGVFESAAPSSSRKAAEAPPPPKAKVRSQDAQELFMAAMRARPGSSEEINGLMQALPGLSGQDRIDALQRLCTRLQDQGDERDYSYCSSWATADPGSAVATKRARNAELRWSASRKAKAAKPPAAAADSLEEPAKAEPQKATTY
ncbi:MAG TPA: zf-HC2 domain-containing protein [Myxococcaceae bacterium]|jgi:hypothetical protein